MLIFRENLESSPTVSQANIDIYACRSKHVIREYHQRLPKLVKEHLSTHPIPAPPSSIQGRVCIIGAGMAGLYTAMILDSLGIQYDILEASNRVGGRVFTHKFRNDGLGCPRDKSRYNYYVRCLVFGGSDFNH